MAAAVELALGGRVLGDVGQPQLRRGAGAEVAVDQIVVDGRPGDLAAALPALLRGGRPDPVLPAQPMDPVLRPPGDRPRSSSSEMKR